MWLKCKSIGGKISSNDRIPVVFHNGKKYSLNRQKILQIKWDGIFFYVNYSTDEKTKKFYENFAEKPPSYAINITLREVKKWTGEKCDCGKYWDADTILEYEHADGVCECPRCGKVLSAKEIVKLYPKLDYTRLVHSLAHDIAKKYSFNVEFLTKCWSNISGGTRPIYKNIIYHKELNLNKIEKLVISQGLKLVESHYDMDTIKIHYDSDEIHVILETDPQLAGMTTGTTYFIFKKKS